MYFFIEILPDVTILSCQLVLLLPYPNVPELIKGFLQIWDYKSEIAKELRDVIDGFQDGKGDMKGNRWPIGADNDLWVAASKKTGTWS